MKDHCLHWVKAPCRNCDVMNRTPRTLESDYARAWRYDVEAFARHLGEGPRGSLDTWVIYAPWANLCWHSYVIHLIHLRPVEGVPAPKLFLEGATHELIIAALEPDWTLNLLARPRMLRPTNFGAQWIDTDAGARAKVEQSVKDILNLYISPDTDYNQHWIAKFGDSMIKKGHDPKSVGETIINLGGTREIKIDPRPLNKLPIDARCGICNFPSVVAPPFGTFCTWCTIMGKRR